MVRMYKRKLLKLDESILSKAVDEVKNGQKLQTVAKKYNIARGTLRGRMNKTNTPLHHKRIFSHEQEISLKEYLIRIAEMFDKLSHKTVRQLAYGYAVQLKEMNQISAIPESWCEQEGLPGSASKDWLCCFMRRHPDLKITAFNNQHNVSTFLNKLKEEIERCKIEAQNQSNESMSNVDRRLQNEISLPLKQEMEIDVEVN